MKYIIVLGDGMADEPIGKLGERTPLQAADTPAMDWLACRVLVVSGVELLCEMLEELA